MMQKPILCEKFELLMKFKLEPGTLISCNSPSSPAGSAARQRALCHGADLSASPFCLFFLDLSADFPDRRLHGPRRYPVRRIFCS